MNLLCSVATAAIVNVLSPQVGPRDPGVHGSVGASGQLSVGNVDQLAVSANAGVMMVGDKHIGLISANGARSVLNDALFVDNAFAHGRHVWTFHDPWSTFSFVQADRNSFRQLQMRNLVGVGLQRRLWGNDWTEGRAGTALMAEYQLLSEGAEDDDAGLHVRNSTYLSIAVERERFTVTSVSFVQPRVDDPSNVRLMEQFTLAVHMTERLDLVWSGTVEHDAHPPEGVETTDIKTKTGLAWSF